MIRRTALFTVTFTLSPAKRENDSGGFDSIPAPNQSMEVIASGRYILLFGTLVHYPVAMCPLARDTSSCFR